MSEITERTIDDVLDAMFADYQEYDWEVMDMAAMDDIKPVPSDFAVTSTLEALGLLLNENSDIREYFVLLVEQMAQERLDQLRADIARAAAA
jgi:hypothetical protein